MAEVKCMNPWIPQSIRQYSTDGIWPALPANSSGGQNRSGVRYAIDQQGGKNNAGYAEDVMMTIMSDSHGTPHAVCYGISAYDSNAMKSSNPHSGIYETDTSRTLDLNCCNPACNQGGVLIVYEGQNCCTDAETSFTLQAGRPDDHHIPCVCIKQPGGKSE